MSNVFDIFTNFIDDNLSLAKTVLSFNALTSKT